MNLLKITVTSSLFIALAVVQSAAQNYSSTYTDLDFDNNCTTIKQDEMGVEASCTGYMNSEARHWPVYFYEGDLRQMVRFGQTTIEFDRWQSFAEFNRAGQTVEWRLDGSTPVAAILRWFIENNNPRTGEISKKYEGQVLVISTVADFTNGRNACVAGYVDARANADANVLARMVADNIAPQFNCKTDIPAYHGQRGKLSGSPGILAD